MYEHEIVAELKGYFSKLDDKMQRSFISDSDDLLKRANNG